MKCQWPITSQNESSKPNTDGLVQPLPNSMTAHQQVALCPACLQIAKPLFTAAQKAELRPNYWTLFTFQFLETLTTTTQR
jgi:hypothetical protein